MQIWKRLGAPEPLRASSWGKDGVSELAWVFLSSGVGVRETHTEQSSHWGLLLGAEKDCGGEAETLMYSG